MWWVGGWGGGVGWWAGGVGRLGWVGVPGTQLRSLDAIEDGMDYDQRSKSDWGLEQTRLSVKIEVAIH